MSRHERDRGLARSQGTVRAIRVAPDGSLPAPAPTMVTAGAASLDVAANAALVSFTRSEPTGRSVRGVLLPAGF